MATSVTLLLLDGGVPTYGFNLPRRVEERVDESAMPSTLPNLAALRLEPEPQPRRRAPPAATGYTNRQRLMAIQQKGLVTDDEDRGMLAEAVGLFEAWVRAAFLNDTVLDMDIMADDIFRPAALTDPVGFGRVHMGPMDWFNAFGRMQFSVGGGFNVAGRYDPDKNMANPYNVTMTDVFGTDEVLVRKSRFGTPGSQSGVKFRNVLIEIWLTAEAGRTGVGPGQHVAVLLPKLSMRAKTRDELETLIRDLDMFYNGYAKDSLEGVLYVSEAFDGDCTRPNLIAQPTFWPVCTRTIVHASRHGFLHGDMKLENLVYRQGGDRNPGIVDIRYIDFDPYFCALIDMSLPANARLAPCIALLMTCSLLGSLRCKQKNSESEQQVLAGAAMGALQAALEPAEWDMLNGDDGQLLTDIKAVCFQAGVGTVDAGDLPVAQQTSREIKFRAFHNFSSYFLERRPIDTNYIKNIRDIKEQQKEREKIHGRNLYMKKQYAQCLRQGTPPSLQLLIEYALGFKLKATRTGVVSREEELARAEAAAASAAAAASTAPARSRRIVPDSSSESSSSSPDDSPLHPHHRA